MKNKPEATIVFCSQDVSKDKDFMDNMKVMAGCEVAFMPMVGYDQITKAYNEAFDKSETELIIFCHNDILIKTDKYIPILQKLFSDHESAGIIGLVGSNVWDGGSWVGEGGQALGHLIQSTKYGVQLPRYIYFSPKFRNNHLIPCVTCDGMFIAVMKSRIKEKFDTNLRGFHFYDVMFTIDNVQKGVKCGITPDILALHKSEGFLNDQWYKSRMYSKAKYGEDFKVCVDLPDGGKMYSETYNRNKIYF